MPTDGILDVIWIAPTIPGLEELGWVKELTTLQKLPDVKLLMRVGAELTANEVADALAQRCRLLIWSGHGQPGGLLLPNNVLVRPLWFVTRINGGCRPQVTILAACGSQLRDTDLHSLTDAMCRAGFTAIGFPARTNDNAAARFCLEFARALVVDDATVSDAFNVAMEAIAGEETAEGVYLVPGLYDYPASELAIMQQIQNSLSEIKQLITYRQARPSGKSASSAMQVASLSTAETPTSTSSIQGISRSTSGHYRGIKGAK